ncbi:type I polyketide synthase, partial [Exilibacterium tricleocarpae]
MTDKTTASFADEQKYEALLNRALVRIKALKSENQALKSNQVTTSIIGMSCSMPNGGDSWQTFWRLLQTGANCAGPVPADRWKVDLDTSAEAADTQVSHAAFIENAYRFDAGFFNIPAVEAVSMDPQHRLLLQETWRALEDAGIDPESLRGGKVGVFVGMMNQDYLHASMQATQSLSAFTPLGNSMGVAAGRISHSFDFNGPSIGLDTNCSSSLVALHLAEQSLQRYECDLAVVAGVNLILLPAMTEIMDSAHALSPVGVSKSFDEDADGYGRGEGCVVVVLRRTADAQAQGDPVLAHLVSSVVKHDGASSGLSVPNGLAQQALINLALKQASLGQDDIDYIEAHGTGTALGDPIELDALQAVFADRKKPLWLGSVKSNIGHLEAAAGLAGLVKVLLSFKYCQIPPNIHFSQPTSRFDWDSSCLEVVTKTVDWSGDRPCRAGISSFGFGGTLAHAILEQAPPRERPAAQYPPREPAVLCVSAKSPAALAALRERYLTFLQETPEPAIGDLCYTAETGRSHFPYRLAVTGTTAVQLHDALSQAELPTAPASSLKVAWLCSGQGSQYAGMGKQLYQQEPVFRAEIDRCADLLADELDLPLTTLLWGEAGDRLDETCYTQPALFAFSYSLAQQWRAWGVEPALLLGHSVGEYVAACLAGVFSLADGLRLIAARGRLMQAQTPAGRMAAVLADVAVVREALADEPATEIAIAAYNGPHNTVVSGAPAAVERVMARLAADGHRVQALA